MLRSYGSIYALGHRAIADLFDGEVVVQEKIDGSQFSFGRVLSVGDDQWGGLRCDLRCRSKGQEIHVEAPEKLFAAAVETATALAPQLVPGHVYRAEYLAKPQHNALAYARIPTRHLILFDVDRGEEDYLDPLPLGQVAHDLGLEAVPTLYRGVVESADALRQFLERESVLGGVRVEGVVVKGYGRFGVAKRTLMGKYVSEAFKEVHAAAWRQANPHAADILDQLRQAYQTPARWQKAVQHLREAGQLEDSPRDIGVLIPEVARDVETECRADIERVLWAWAWPKLRRRLTAGLPEWYKQRLLDQAFVRDPAA